MLGRRRLEILDADKGQRAALLELLVGISSRGTKLDNNARYSYITTIGWDRQRRLVVLSTDMG